MVCYDFRYNMVITVSSYSQCAASRDSCSYIFELSLRFTNLLYLNLIIDGSYFSHIPDDASSEVILKKLRFYARYIVVCILLNRKALVADSLHPELMQYVQQYRNKLSAADTRGMVIRLLCCFYQCNLI